MAAWRSCFATGSSAYGLFDLSRRACASLWWTGCEPQSAAMMPPLEATVRRSRLGLLVEALGRII